MASKINPKKIRKKDKKDFQLSSNRSDLIVEYQECGTNMRHYSNLRFAILTIFAAATAALIPAYDKFPTLKVNISIVPFFGVLLCIIFLVMHERTVDLWLKFYKRAITIEEIMLFSQYKSRREGIILSNRNATRLLFSCLIIFWLIIAFAKCNF